MVDVTYTWEDAWNDIIRYVIFPDEKLKAAMAIPEESLEDIQVFRDQYFVNDAMSDVLLTDEAVRICYYQDPGFSLNNHVKRRLLRFDIYVKREHQYNVDAVDRLKQRQKVIARRLRDLLAGSDFVQGIHFEYEDEYDLPVKLPGYVRFHVYFSYKITH